MDELSEQFGATLDSGRTEPDSLSGYDALYKNWGRLSNQEERRKEILVVQRRERNSNLDKSRGILELVNEMQENDLFHTKKVYYRPAIYVSGFHRKNYSNVLILSEWMIEKPNNMSEWYFVLCPKGIRLLVVAYQGITKCYSKLGHFKFEAKTVLPGGNKTDPKHKSKCCVLDCFYYELTETMYIIDILAWNKTTLTDGDVDFRSFWLNTHLTQEAPNMDQISKQNKVRFVILPKYEATDLSKELSRYPAFENNAPPLDGLLFYHKRGMYIGGETPLVGWLYPYMVPEVLGSDITVHEEYMKSKPADYVNQAEFIHKFELKVAKKQTKRQKNAKNAMDTTDETANQGATEAMESEGNNPTEEMESENNNPKEDSKETNTREAISEENKHSEAMGSNRNNTSEQMESDMIQTESKPETAS